MLPLSFFSFASVLGIPLGAIVIAVAGIILSGVIVVTGLFFEHQRRRLWHETARIALERGQPLPPYADEAARHTAKDHRDSPARDFRSGLVMLGAGVGLYFLVGLGIAAIVGCIGIALLIYALFALIFARKQPPQP
jgi:hypothetical protein